MKSLEDSFKEMRSTLLVKQEYHRFRREVYEGKNEAETLNVALPKKFDQKLSTHLGWGKTVVDTLLHDTTFDGFKNDTLGFTKLLDSFGGYAVGESARRNAMIGACSFVTVLPKEDGTPFFTAYSGAEATGIYDSRVGFVAGLVTNSFTSSFGIKSVKDYLLFTPGVIYKVAPDGEILEAVDMPTQRMLFIPFVNEQDVAIAPFGSSRINAPFINALESALRTLKLIEVGHDVRMAIRNILMADGTAPTDLKKSEQDVDMLKLLAIFNEGQGTLKLEQLAAPSTEELQRMISLLASNAASAVGMDSTAFGYQPSNGSFSSETLDRMGRPYQNLVRSARESFGQSYKEMAIAAMSLVTGQYSSDWNSITPAFSNNMSPEKFGAVADGINKLSTVAPEVDFSSYIEEKVLSKSIREEALKVNLPSFTAAKKNSERYTLLKSEELVV